MLPGGVSWRTFAKNLVWGNVDLKKQWDFWGQLVAGDDSDTTKPETGPSGEMRLGDLTSQGGYGYLMMKVRLPTK